MSALTGVPAFPETVVVLTTWNRPSLLRQSLPQIERETDSIGARLVIADDQSDDPATLALLEGAERRGATVIRRAYVRARDPDFDVYLHNSPETALAHVEGTACFSRWAEGSESGGLPSGDSVIARLERTIGVAHEYIQLNNLFAIRHVIATYPTAGWLVKVDDDVVLADGAFAALRRVWQRAAADGLDVLAVSGIRTVNEEIVARRDGYAITRGACNVAILYRVADWVDLLARLPEPLIVRDGFDLAFVWQYAPRHRSGAVAISLTPSVAYHAGFNGVHVRNADLNCEYGGSLDDVVVQ